MAGKRKSKHLHPALIFGPAFLACGVFLFLLCGYVWGGQYLICQGAAKLDCELEIRRWFGSSVDYRETYSGVVKLTDRPFAETRLSNDLMNVPNRSRHTQILHQLFVTYDKGEASMLGGTRDEVMEAIGTLGDHMADGAAGTVRVNIYDIPVAIGGAIFGFVFSLAGLVILGLYFLPRKET